MGRGRARSSNPNSNAAPRAGLGIGHFLLGGLWYSPLMMSKPWMHAMGLRSEDISEGGMSMTRALVVSAITSFMTAYFLSFLLAFTSDATAVMGALFGFFAWLVFGLSSYARAHVWEDRPIKLIAIDSGYEVLGATVVGGILGAFG